jgi:hypothetical protein
MFAEGVGDGVGDGVVPGGRLENGVGLGVTPGASVGDDVIGLFPMVAPPLPQPAKIVAAARTPRATC